MKTCPHCSSGIPDYSMHPLYGKKDFDHSQYPVYANHPNDFGHWLYELSFEAMSF